MGLTVMLTVLTPVLHRYVDPPDAVSVVELPAQSVVLPAIVIVGKGFTVTVISAVPVHPDAFVPLRYSLCL